jgi:hypothetical protein
MRHHLRNAALVAMTIASPGVAYAGCATGAAVGGVAGHVAGHHAILGAALTGITGAPTTSVYSGAYGSSSAWSTVTFDFTASSASEILSFLAYGTPVGGPPVALLDNVSLEDIPEPSGIAAVGIAAMLGVVTWRRRTRRSI